MAPFLDVTGDGLHLLVTGVLALDPAGLERCEEQRKYTCGGNEINHAYPPVGRLPGGTGHEKASSPAGKYTWCGNCSGPESGTDNRNFGRNPKRLDAS
jgi:hypothetical protein